MLRQPHAAIARELFKTLAFAVEVDAEAALAGLSTPRVISMLLADAGSLPGFPGMAILL